MKKNLSLILVLTIFASLLFCTNVSADVKAWDFDDGALPSEWHGLERKV